MIGIMVNRHRFIYLTLTVVSRTVVSSFLILYPKLVHAERHGEITSRPCPYKCQIVGIPKKDCRDWREGNTCYVEDLTKPPSREPAQQPGRSYDHPTDLTSSNSSSHPRPATEECKYISRYDIGKPRIDLGRLKHTGNIFKDKYKVSGSVEGICLVEAGYFEQGRKVHEIPVATTRDFRRYDFQVEVRASRDPEIRVYNTAGDYDVVDIDPGEEDGGEDDWDRDRGDRYDYDRDRYDRRREW